MQALSALIRGYPADCSVQDTLLLGRPTLPALARVAPEAMDCRLAGGARRFFLQAKALEALALVIAEADADAAEPGLRPPECQRVWAAATLLASRYGEPWTIATLSREVGLNEHKLKHGFRTIVGCTIHDCLTSARLDAAAHMLADGASVTETALAVGYNNLSHFAKAFRRRHGATRRSWRGAGHGGITPELARIPFPVRPPVTRLLRACYAPVTRLLRACNRPVILRVPAGGRRSRERRDAADNRRIPRFP